MGSTCLVRPTCSRGIRTLQPAPPPAPGRARRLLRGEDVDTPARLAAQSAATASVPETHVRVDTAPRRCSVGSSRAEAGGVRGPRVLLRLDVSGVRDVPGTRTCERIGGLTDAAVAGGAEVRAHQSRLRAYDLAIQVAHHVRAPSPGHRVVVSGCVPDAVRVLRGRLAGVASVRARLPAPTHGVSERSTPHAGDRDARSAVLCEFILCSAGLVCAVARQNVLLGR